MRFGRQNAPKQTLDRMDRKMLAIGRRGLKPWGIGLHQSRVYSQHAFAPSRWSWIGPSSSSSSSGRLDSLKFIRLVRPTVERSLTVGRTHGSRRRLLRLPRTTRPPIITINTTNSLQSVTHTYKLLYYSVRLMTYDRTGTYADSIPPTNEPTHAEGNVW